LRVKIVFAAGLRFAGEGVDAAMDVGVVVAVVVVERREHRLRLLRGRRGIEVDDALAADLAREDREVGAHVECGHAGGRRHRVSA